MIVRRDLLKMILNSLLLWLIFILTSWLSLESCRPARVGCSKWKYPSLNQFKCLETCKSQIIRVRLEEINVVTFISSSDRSCSAEELLFLASCSGAALSLLLPAASGMLCCSHLHCHTCGARRALAEEAPFSTPAGWKVPQPWARRPLETRKALLRETTPPPKSCRWPSMTHGHMIAALRACPLRCARARVHNVHTHTRSTERVCHNKCKGHETTACCCTCRHDGILYYIIQYITLHYVLLCSFVFYYIILCYAYFIKDVGIVGMQPHAGVPAVFVFTCVFLDIQSAPPAVKAAAGLQSSYSQLRLKVKRRGQLAYTTTRWLSENGLESPTDGAQVL